MTTQFSSKEIHFLKNESDEFSITPPEIYYGDLLLAKPVQVKTFEERLEKSQIPGECFLCAVLRISADISDTLRDKAKDTFEATFTSILDHGRGIWESISDTSFALAFWDYDSEKKASGLLVSLKEKLHNALASDILMGVAWFPFHDFTRPQTLANALKALDHAAFFGPDALVHFDAVSLNISGDRLYQLGHSETALLEYQKGLEISPKDINLINSLGVCYGIRGELDKASEQFEAAMKINPEELMVVYNLGLLHNINGNTDKAVVYLRKAHGINQEVFEVELLLARLLLQENQLGPAMAHLSNAEKIDTESGQVFRLKGEILLEKKQAEEAAQAFNRAIKLMPSDAVSLSGYAKCLALQDKNLTIALSFARNSVALDPENTLFTKRLEEIQARIEAAPPQETTIKTA